MENPSQLDDAKMPSLPTDSGVNNRDVALHESLGAGNRPVDANFTLCCPCKCFAFSATICLLSTVDILKLCCCGLCTKRRKPTWNLKFELSNRVARNITFMLMRQPNYRVVRMIADANPPRWLPVMARGITSTLGDHLELNTSLPGYEFIYPRKQGSPDFSNDGANLDQRNFILYFHGGAFSFGCRGSHRQLLFEMSKQLGGITIISIEYRRCPEVSYPIPGQDCFAAYKWLISKQVDPSRIILAGDSAGGALAIEVMLQIRDAGLPPAKAAILLSPWVDLFDEESKSVQENICFDFLPPGGLTYYARMYHSPPNDSVSPIYKDLSNLGSHILVEFGESEILRDSIFRFIKLAKDAGNSIQGNCYEGMPHVHLVLNLTKVKACAESFVNIKTFIDSLYPYIPASVNSSSNNLGPGIKNSKGFGTGPVQLEEGLGSNPVDLVMGQESYSPMQSEENVEHIHITIAAESAEEH